MAWQGNGMGAAWARHAVCESAFNIHAISEVARQRTERPPRFAFTLCTRSVQLTRNCGRWETNRET